MNTPNIKTGFFDRYDKVIVFSGDKATTAKYLKSYEVRHGEEPHISDECSKLLYENYKENMMHPLFEIDNDPLALMKTNYLLNGRAAVKWNQKQQIKTYYTTNKYEQSCFPDLKM